MQLAGYGVHDKNVRFRLYCLVLAGICSFGAVMYWRSATLMASEYQDIPVFAYENPKRVHAKVKTARARDIQKALEDEETTKRKN